VARQLQIFSGYNTQGYTSIKVCQIFLDFTVICFCIHHLKISLFFRKTPVADRMATVKCPLYPKKLKATKSMTLHQLRAIERHISTNSCSHPPLKEFVFKGHLKGSTPLLLACHHGDLDSVKHIVENWGADIEATAVYHIIGSNIKRSPVKTIQAATPLFVAACKGHIDIVRYLVEKGADVSSKTSSEANQKFNGLTPLHGAVLEPYWSDKNGLKESIERNEIRSAIVTFLLESGADPSSLSSDGTPIWMRPYCGAKAITNLINHGLILNQRNRRGQTILHVWSNRNFNRITKEESLAVIKLLLEKGARYLLMARDYCGFTPIMEAAFCKYGEEANMKVLDFLLESESIDRSEKIDALELACTIIRVNSESSRKRQQAFEYWRRALRLRLNQDPPLHKIPLKLKSGLTKEWTTFEELEHVIQHPSEHEIQSILVRLRILSGRGCKAICNGIHVILSHRSCWSILEQGRYVEVLDILWAILELLRRVDPAERQDHWIVEACDCLTSTLLKMKTNSSVLLNASAIKTSLNLILETDPFKSFEWDDIHDDDVVYVNDYDPRLRSNTFQIFRFIALIADLLPQMVLDEESMDSLGLLVRRKRKNSSGRTLLHLACENPNRLETVRLLLQLGANPNAGDKQGNSPLHSLAQQNRELIDPTARLLLENGAHLDRVNKSGKTAVDLWLEKHGSRKRRLDEGDQQGAVGFKNDLPDWCIEGVPRLLCLSSRKIRARRIPYLEAPVTLHPFIEMH